MTNRKIRQSQTIVPFGAGGIFDFKGESFVGMDIRFWPNQAKNLEFPRLANKLGVRRFKTAPVAPSGRGKPPVDWPRLPYQRFPAWLFCDQCRRMYRWKSTMEQSDEEPTCERCARQPKLVPMRFIQICTHGHLSDVDWAWWAHSMTSAEDRGDCQDGSDLRFKVSSESSGLDALTVVCNSCPAQRNLFGIGTPNMVKKLGITCSGRQPWQRYSEAIKCDEPPKIVQRGAANVYFPNIVSAIDIPSMTSHAVSREADSTTENILNHVSWEKFLAAASPFAEVYRSLISMECEVPEEAVDALAEKCRQTTTGSLAAQASADVDLANEEWLVFAAPADVRPSNANFITRDGDLEIQSDGNLADLSIAEIIKGVVLVDRLREVRTITGYSRYEPGDTSISVDPTNKRPKWLPAVETFGEGIFIRFDEQRLNDWERHPSVRSRVTKLDGDLSKSFQQDRLREPAGARMLPRYPLIHTIAHLLIRQLSFECGYNTASLRERVYAREVLVNGAPTRQAGVLIYTAAGDAEGTLGGLVRQGQKPFLMETLIRMLEAGAWCSADPLCCESPGQGLGNLNRAACHACALLPETSCEAGNTLLDRVLVIGSPTVPGFFEGALSAARTESMRGLWT